MSFRSMHLKAIKRNVRHDSEAAQGVVSKANRGICLRRNESFRAARRGEEIP
jgi:inorganic triphosphatase YgiF